MKPVVIQNPDPKSKDERIVILGNYCAITNFAPFHKDSLNNPIETKPEFLSDWVKEQYKEASKHYSDEEVKFFKSDDLQVNMLLAANVKDPESLKKLAQSDSISVRRVVARETNDPELLTLLSDDKSSHVRREVAKHDNFEILLKLADDPSFLVVEAVATHNYAEVLEKASNYESSFSKTRIVLQEIAKHNNPEILEKISKSLYATSSVYAEIAKHNLPEVHKKLMPILFEDHYTNAPALKNIARHNNREEVEVIVKEAELYPFLQKDEPYREVLLEIAKHGNKDILSSLKDFTPPEVKAKKANKM